MVTWFPPPLGMNGEGLGGAEGGRGHMTPPPQLGAVGGGLEGWRIWGGGMSWIWGVLRSLLILGGVFGPGGFH